MKTNQIVKFSIFDEKRNFGRNWWFFGWL